MAARAALWGDALPVREPGHVALVSQSGNVAVNALAALRGLRFHTVVSSGNQAVLRASDYLAHLAARRGRALDRALPRGRRRRRRAVRGARRVRRRGHAGRRAEGRRVGGGRGRRGRAHGRARGRPARLPRARRGGGRGVGARRPRAARAGEGARRDAAPGAAGAGLAILTCSGGDSSQGADEAAALGLELPALAPADRASGSRRCCTRRRRSANPLDYTATIWGDADALAGDRHGRRRGPRGRPGARLLRPAARARGRGRGVLARGARRDRGRRAQRSPVPTMVCSTLPELLDDAAAWHFAQAGVAAAAGLRTGLRAAAAMRARARRRGAAARRSPRRRAPAGAGRRARGSPSTRPRRCCASAGIAVVEGRAGRRGGGGRRGRGRARRRRRAQAEQRARPAQGRRSARSSSACDAPSRSRPRTGASPRSRPRTAGGARRADGATRASS